MAENLNYETSTGSWRYFDNDPDNRDTYGRLYDWATEMDLNDSCNIKEFVLTVAFAKRYGMEYLNRFCKRL